MVRRYRSATGKARGWPSQCRLTSADASSCGVLEDNPSDSNADLIPKKQSELGACQRHPGNSLLCPSTVICRYRAPRSPGQIFSATHASHLTLLRFLGSMTLFVGRSPEFGFGSVSPLQGPDPDRFRRARFGFGSVSPGQVRIRIGFRTAKPGSVRFRKGLRVHAGSCLCIN